MTSVKCLSCGLVNFSTEKSCKRCKSPLAGAGNGTQQFQSFQNPPPPPVFHGDPTVREQVSVPAQRPPCIKCGSRQNISVRNFVKFYNSPVAFLGIFLGLLPYILLKLLLRTKHDLTAPFCEPCWGKFRHLGTCNVLNTLLFFPLLIVGVVFAFAVDSEWVLLAAVLLPFLVLALGSFYLKTLEPKYKRVNSKEVVIDAPYVGEILYTR